MNHTKHLRAGLLAILTCCWLGCSGEEDGPTPPIVVDPPSTNLAAAFDSDGSIPAERAAWLAEVSATGAVITLKINARGMDDVYAASFDVEFDPAYAELVDWAPGDLLERNGFDTTYQVQASSGRVVVGVSRVGDVPGANIGGPKTLIFLTFRLTREGASRADFSNATILHTGNGAPEAIAGLSWIGGVFRAL